METKKDIRRSALARRNQLAQLEWVNSSELIYQKLIKNNRYIHEDVIYCYVDYCNEVGTTKIIEHAWSMNKKVAVPRVLDDEMSFYYISSFDDLEEGFRGILEPKKSCEEAFEKGLVIMPGAAFDRTCNRIGYGKGYYDKYFSKYPDLCKIAIAFSLQIVSEIQADKFDVKADCVITESVIYE